MAVLSCGCAGSGRPESGAGKRKAADPARDFAHGSGGFAWVPRPWGETWYRLVIEPMDQTIRQTVQPSKRRLLPRSDLFAHAQMRAATATLRPRNDQNCPLSRRLRGRRPSRRRIGPARESACRASRRPPSGSTSRPSSFSDAPGRSAPTGPRTDRNRSARNDDRAAIRRRCRSPPVVCASASAIQSAWLRHGKLAAPPKNSIARGTRASRPPRIDDEPAGEDTAPFSPFPRR